MKKSQQKLWGGLIVMALLSPLGIILPERFKSGDAWGEWGTDTLAELLGYVPEGLKKYAGLWQAPLSDYTWGGNGSPAHLPLASTVLSALLGVILAGLALWLIARFLVRHDE